jgi:hypothetical protein
LKKILIKPKKNKKLVFELSSFLAKTRAAKADANEVKSFSFLFFCFYIYLNFKVNPEVLGVIENEKKNLLSQLRDYEWRLEQENKVIYLYSSP